MDRWMDRQLMDKWMSILVNLCMDKLTNGQIGMENGFMYS